MSIQNRTRRRDRTARNRVEHASVLAGPAGVAAGSRVQTRRGEILIENLVPGEEILTAHGNFSPVRSVDVAEFTQPHRTALPVVSVRVRKDALGPMRPHQDVLVGAGQIIQTEAGPASAASLLNGRTIIQDWEARPRMVLVALDGAEPLLVDGMSVGATG